MAPSTSANVAPVAAPTAEQVVAKLPSVQPRYRRVGMRLSCLPCEVAWTGSSESSCWVCEGPGVPGPPPSIYPDS